MNDRPIYHRTEILSELRREYSWRKRLYPGWVKQGRLDARQAEKQMQILDQAIQEYARGEINSDLFALRTAASMVAAEVAGMIGISLNAAQLHVVADRIARAMKEGK